MPVRLLLLCSLALIFTGCKQEVPRIPTIGEAFVGPISLPVRQDLATNSAVVTTLKHGDRLDLLQARRRFLRVRTPQGVEGWVDGRSLITPQQMSDLRQLSDRNKNTPSQGKAKNFELLNMHSEPSRVSPSFFQIAENSLVDVIGQRSTVRASGDAAAPAVFTPPKPPPRARKKSGKEKAAPKLAIPPPAAPKLPENWRELSYRRPAEEAAKREEPESRHGRKGHETPQIKIDDWSLVRTKDGRVGWVLSRMIQMAVPDDVAQYAEGHHITSYFLLENVQDGDLKKGHWLWTTLNKAGQPYQFDSFRVFIWSMHRHRYETAYIERNVVGFYPTNVGREEISLGKTKETVPVFAVLLRNDEGSCYRKKFAFEVNRARFLGKEPAACPGEPGKVTAEPGVQMADTAPETKPVAPSLTQRIKDWKNRLFGGKKQ